VWSQVAESSQNTKPWVFLSNGSGEFGYVPVEAGAEDPDDPILLRCVIIDVDGQAAKQMNLLLPARRALRLTVPDAGQLAGRPVRVTVSATKEWTGVDLEVVADTTGSVGLTGRTISAGHIASRRTFGSGVPDIRCPLSQRREVR